MLASKALYKKYLLLFFVVLFIPMLIMFYLINSTILPVIHTQMVSQHDARMIKAKERLDQHFIEFQRIAVSIDANPDLSPYMISRNNYYSYQGMNELRMYGIANDFISDIIYYTRGDSRLYMMNQAVDLKLFTERMYPFSLWSPEQFYDEIDTIEYPSIRPVSSDLLAYVYPIGSGEPYATVVFLIKKASIWNLLDHAMIEPVENVYLFNGNNRIIAVLNEERAWSESEWDHIGSDFDENNGSILIQNSKYHMAYIKSDFTTLRLVSIIENNQFSGLTNVIKQKIILYLLAIFLICAIIVFAVSHRSLAPLYELLKSIEKRTGKGATEKNEWHRIESMFEHMFQKNQHLQEKLDRTKPMVRNYLLNDLLAGRLNSEGLEELNNASALDDINGNKNYVAVLRGPTGIRLDAVWSIVLDKFRETRHTSIYPIERMKENEAIFIVTTKQGEAGITEQTLDFIRQHIKKEHEWDAIIAIGASYTDILQIGQSYMEAVNKLDIIESSSGLSLQHFADHYGILRQENDIASYPYQKLDRISILVENGNLKEVSLIIEDLLTSISSAAVPAFFRDCIMFDIINTLIKLSAKLNIDLNRLNAEYPQLFEVHNADEVEKVLGLLNGVCQYISDCILSQDNEANELRKKMDRYIDEHYREYSFGLESMAGHLQLTVPYVSQLFKELKGQTFTEYVWEMKCKEAKQLLAESDWPVQRIVYHVGYNNMSSFSRKFKKTTGMTPTEYREQTKGTVQDLR